MVTVMEKSTVKDDVLDRAVSGAPAEKVPFGGDKKEQTIRAGCPSRGAEWAERAPRSGPGHSAQQDRGGRQGEEADARPSQGTQAMTWACS